LKGGTDLGNRIAQICEIKNVKIIDLSRNTGLARSYVYDVIKGKSIPTIKTGRKIAEFLGVSLEELFPEEDKRER